MWSCHLIPNQEIPGSIAGSFVGFFTDEVFHVMYGTDISVFVSFFHVLSCAVFGGSPCTLWSHVRGGSPIVSVFLCTVQSNFFYYRTCMIVVPVEVNPKENKTKRKKESESIHSVQGSAGNRMRDCLISSRQRRYH